MAFKNAAYKQYSLTPDMETVMSGILNLLNKWSEVNDVVLSYSFEPV